MHDPISRGALLLLVAGALTQTDCGFLGFTAMAAAMVACPELADNKLDPSAMKITSDAAMNADIAAFVGAARDLINLAGDAEEEAKLACLQIGHDLGLSDEKMAPVEGVSGSTAGACGAVAKRISKIIRKGLRIEVRIEPPRCEVAANVFADCTAKCSASASASGDAQAQAPEPRRPNRLGGGGKGDRGGEAAGGAKVSAQCDSSCKAHANLTARCDPPAVTIRSQGGHPDADKLAATLQANLPRLVRAGVGLAQRAVADAETLVRVGAELPAIVDKAGEHATGCVAGSAAIIGMAAASLSVTVDASASVSGSLGAE